MTQRPRAYVTYALAALNVLLFLLTEISGPTEVDSEVLIRWGALYTPALKSGEYWRFITAMFLHSGIRHLVNNMIALLAAGTLLEEELGRVRFGILYLLGGLAGNALEYALAESKGRTIMAVGASGAVFALLGALLWCIILHHGHFRGMSLRRLLIYLVISAYFGLTASGVANGAHFGGLAFGFLFCILIYRKKDGMEPFPYRTDGPADERSFYG